MSASAADSAIQKKPSATLAAAPTSGWPRALLGRLEHDARDAADRLAGEISRRVDHHLDQMARRQRLVGVLVEREADGHLPLRHLEIGLDLGSVRPVADEAPGDRGLDRGHRGSAGAVDRLLVEDRLLRRRRAIGAGIGRRRRIGSRHRESGAVGGLAAVARRRRRGRPSPAAPASPGSRRSVFLPESARRSRADPAPRAAAAGSAAGGRRRRCRSRATAKPAMRSVIIGALRPGERADAADHGEDQHGKEDAAEARAPRLAGVRPLLGVLAIAATAARRAAMRCGTLAPVDLRRSAAGGLPRSWSYSGASRGSGIVRRRRAGAIAGGSVACPAVGRRGGRPAARLAGGGIPAGRYAGSARSRPRRSARRADRRRAGGGAGRAAAARCRASSGAAPHSGRPGRARRGRALAPRMPASWMARRKTSCGDGARPAARSRGPAGIGTAGSAARRRRRCAIRGGAGARGADTPAAASRSTRRIASSSSRRWRDISAVVSGGSTALSWPIKALRALS